MAGGIVLKNLLKFASAYQGVAFSVLLVLEIWVYVFILKYNLKIFSLDRLLSISNLIMNLSLAFYFYNAGKVLGSETSAQAKFKFWGKCSIFAVGVVQLTNVFFPRRFMLDRYFENSDSLSGAYEVLAFLFQYRILAYQVLDIFSSSSNLLFTVMIYLFVDRFANGDIKV